MSAEELSNKHELLRELLDKLRLDDAGRLVLGDVPMIITDREFIALIQKVAEEVLGEGGAATIMYRAGYISAYSFSEAHAKLFGISGFDILRKYLELASVRGWWSKHEIVELSEEPLRVVVRFWHTVAEEWGNVGRPVCHMWRGGLAGILRYVAESMDKKVEIRVRETACVAMGDPYCEMVAEAMG